MLTQLFCFRNNKLNVKKQNDGITSILSFKNTIVVGDQLGVIGVWTIDQGKTTRRLKLIGHSHSVTCCILINPAEQLIASGSEGQLNSIRVWNLNEGGLCVATLKGHTNTVTSMVSLRKGAILVSGSHDGYIKVWDLHTKEIQRSLISHGYAVLCLCKTQDEKVVISGGDDFKIRLWQTDHFCQLNDLELHQGSILSIISLQQQYFASTSNNGDLLIWDLNGQTYHLQQKICIDRKNQLINASGLTYLVNKQLIVTACEDRSIRIFDENKGSPVFELENAHNDSISCISHTEDQNALITGSWDGLIRIWSIK